jgi:Pentapeptide repeats (9 copies)
VHRTRKRERWSVAVSFLSVIVAAGAVAMSWRSAEASDKSARASQEQVEIAKRGQLDERFNRAVQQLGNRDSIDIRQGGIYALESLLRDSPAHRPVVLKYLASFVREHAPVSGCAERKGVPEDIRAAVGVIGHHNIPPDTRVREYSVDLRATCLSEMDLVGMNFVRGYFAGSDLSGSELTGADFTGAYLLSARLGRVSAIQANFTCAVLANADFGEALLAATRFVGSDLKYANFAGAALAGVDWQDADIIEALVDPKQLDDPDVLKKAPQPFCLTEGQYPGITRG